jgi:hypothetical protein
MRQDEGRLKYSPGATTAGGGPPSASLPAPELPPLTPAGQIDHVYVVNLRYAFQDDENCFFVLDLMLGGDLRCKAHSLHRFSTMK